MASRRHRSVSIKPTTITTTCPHKCISVYADFVWIRRLVKQKEGGVLKVARRVQPSTMAFRDSKCQNRRKKDPSASAPGKPLVFFVSLVHQIYEAHMLMSRPLTPACSGKAASTRGMIALAFCFAPLMGRVRFASLRPRLLRNAPSHPPARCPGHQGKGMGVHTTGWPVSIPTTQRPPPPTRVRQHALSVPWPTPSSTTTTPQAPQHHRLGTRITEEHHTFAFPRLAISLTHPTLPPLPPPPLTQVSRSSGRTSRSNATPPAATAALASLPPTIQSVQQPCLASAAAWPPPRPPSSFSSPLPFPPPPVNTAHLSPKTPCL